MFWVSLQKSITNSKHVRDYCDNSNNGRPIWKMKPLLDDLVILLPLFSSSGTSKSAPLSALSLDLFALLLRPDDLVVFLPLFSNWETSAESSPLSPLSSELFALDLCPDDLVFLLLLFSNWVTSESSLVSSLSSKLYALMIYTYEYKAKDISKDIFRQHLSRDVYKLGIKILSFLWDSNFQD